MTLDSGTLCGHRTIVGGRAEARSVRYRATFAAVRYNPALKAFYDRRRATGMPARVALTATARKLLVIADLTLRTGRPWQVSRTCLATTKATTLSSSMPAETA